MNITYSKSIKVLVSALVFTQAVYADKNTGSGNGGNPIVNVVGCSEGKAKTEMDINNIRTTILSGGDMWWDLTNPKYEVPKNSGLNSLYSGALWIGGTDVAGNIKIAAQTYRQTGNDMWPGAIDTANISVDPARCKKYDRHWKISKAEVFDYVFNGADATKDIKEWPGNGDENFNEAFYLAPYVVSDTTPGADQHYNTSTRRDYPNYNFSGVYANNVCNDYVFGDQTLWWVINDVGDIHSETTGDQIGLEIRCQAFGFQTNDEINNMTFYKYQIINRSNQSLNNTYFGVWVDPDLGKATDDYVGCDVTLGLGYVYNGDEDDDGAGGYGSNPPACGVDFFQGPLADYDTLGDGIDNNNDGTIDNLPEGDGIDNDKDGVTDEYGEQIIMSKFVYYNNVNNSPTGNPNGAAHFYNYLQGKWGNGQTMTYGGDGFNPANDTCDYMFPGNTDSAQFANNGSWSEDGPPPNTPEDRRFIQSAGKFTLQPGAVNYITIGAVWSRAAAGGRLASVNIMKLADSKAQAVFDNCFQVLDGPSAPDLSIRELENQIVISVENYNNENVELYSEKDPTLPNPNPVTGILYTDEEISYKFQGYILYQFKDATVSTTDIGNLDKVRLLAQCDTKDSIAQIVNNTFDDKLNYWVPQEMVDGNNKGIQHVFVVSTDLFASGNTALINNLQYYYCIVSYAYNNFADFVPSSISLNGTQNKPFFRGRSNIKTYTAIPHIPQVENNGQIFGAELNSIPSMQRIEGQGNNGLVLDMMDASANEALTGPGFRSYFPVYEKNKSPLKISVYDPVQIPAYSFEIKFDGVANTAGWVLKNLDNGNLSPSERPIGTISEQVLGFNDTINKKFDSYGMTANIANQIEAGNPGATNNGFLEATISYTDPTKPWIDFIADLNGNAYEDWIKSGKDATGTTYPGIDDGKVYEGVLGGTWGPFKICAKNKSSSPKWNNSNLDNPLAYPQFTLDKLASVDVVFTSDQSKWTRCAVFELCKNSAGTEPAGSNTKQFSLRKSASLNKNFVAAVPTDPPSDDPNSPSYIYSTGMSWFPGYAINIETGERLNIAFGENSCIDGNMKWDPTSLRYTTDSLGNQVPVFGGMHYIYVFGHNADGPNDCPRYDYGRWIVSKTKSNQEDADKRNCYKDAMWVSCPMLKSGQSLNATDCKVRLRVIKTFRTYDTRKELFTGDQLAVGTAYKVLLAPIVYNTVTYPVGSTFTTDSVNLTFTGYGSVQGGATYNNSNPYYKFGTSDLVNNPNNKEAAVDALSFINIVPNPYYAYSKYETNQVDNRVRITNLPSNCTVSIFTMNGTLIKKYKRAVAADNSAGGTADEGDNTSTSLDWDLKNTKGIPVASGLYLIHVDAPGLGEKVLKFFAVMRPVDLDTY
ncbi:MAG: hypothetical protein ABI723_24815 [Bacteroidia bacterium]